MFMESLEQISGIMSDSADALGAIVALIQLMVSGVGFVFTVISAIFAFLVAVAVYILHAIPVYKLAKKTKTPHAWLAWVPIYSIYFRTFLLANMAGNKPFLLFKGKINIANRRNAFWIYLAVALVGGAVAGMISTVLGSVFSVIPVLGTALGYLTGYALGLLPTVACAFAEYVFLRDVLDMFKPDKSANNTAAIIVTLLDNVVTQGWAQTIWLYTLLKRRPLPKMEEVVDAAV